MKSTIICNYKQSNRYMFYRFLQRQLHMLWNMDFTHLHFPNQRTYSQVIVSTKSPLTIDDMGSFMVNSEICPLRFYLQGNFFRIYGFSEGKKILQGQHWRGEYLQGRSEKGGKIELCGRACCITGPLRTSKKVAQIRFKSFLIRGHVSFHSSQFF